MWVKVYLVVFLEICFFCFFGVVNNNYSWFFGIRVMFILGIIVYVKNDVLEVDLLV